MIRFSTMLLGGIWLSSATAGDSTRDELKSFQGTWKIIRMEQSGKAMTKEAIAKGHIVFEGNEMNMKGLKDLACATATLPFAFDVAKGTFDLTTVTFNDGKAEKLILPGIYAFEQNKLRICVGNELSDKGKARRPKEFRSSKENGAMLLILEKN